MQIGLVGLVADSSLLSTYLQFTPSWRGGGACAFLIMGRGIADRNDIIPRSLLLGDLINLFLMYLLVSFVNPVFSKELSLKLFVRNNCIEI